MIKIVLLILFAEIWGTTGQIFFKSSVNRLDMPNLRNLGSYLKFLKEVIISPKIWIGFAFGIIGLTIWLIALAHADLSLAFPIDSMQYIVTLLAAHIFLNEKLDRFKVGGTLLIVCGIFLVSMS